MRQVVISVLYDSGAPGTRVVLAGHHTDLQELRADPTFFYAVGAYIRPDPRPDADGFSVCSIDRFVKPLPGTWLADVAITA